MQEINQATDSLQEIKNIRRIMERSSRFISLSGLSGIAAGICALAGSFIANRMVASFRNTHTDIYDRRDEISFFSIYDYKELKYKLVALALGVFLVAFLASFYLTWRKAKNMGMPMWDHTSKRLAWNMIIPLLVGGAFIFGMLRYDIWMFVAPSCLIFYGLALVNASKYTFSDIRYLGYCEILLGIVNMFFIGKGLWFWAAGFGVLHIIYGAIMWKKYESNV
jgi:hypothetical protein